MKSLRYLLISSLSLLLTCAPKKVEEKPVETDLLAEIEKLDIKSDKRVDSILLILSDTSKANDKDQNAQIHALLQQMIEEKKAALEKLDQINAHMDSIEQRVHEYVAKKNSNALRQKLLQDIQRLKKELEVIKPRTLTEVVQKPLPNSLKSLTELPPGNYRSRIDKTHILQFYVDSVGDIFVAPLILDSTTVFKSGTINPKVAEQIQKIKESLKNEKQQ